MYSQEEFDAQKTRIMKYIVFKKRTEQEVRTKFANSVEEKMLEDIYSKYKAERVTIQSGGTLNGMFVRNKLIDYVNIVIAPMLMG